MKTQTLNMFAATNEDLPIISGFALTELAITTNLRAPGESSYHIDGHQLHYQWVSAWVCPSCQRRTVELFEVEPTHIQLSAIQQDPICTVCRHKNNA